ncbi:MAG: cytochrome c-type biogenesis protein CcmH [Proteobacteria bacterium]|nr:cytochrome c-type biogenesis protein CcmH [Pseudomonadota bacterium]
MIRALILFAMVVAATPVFSVQPGEQLPDPAQEARARRLSAELRCLVCQNQSIDDSDAALAGDLRRLVRERIKAGDDDAMIRAFLVSRYGEFVLLKPPFSSATLLLWGLPIGALMIGLFAASRLFSRQQPEDAPDPSAENEAPLELSEEEHDRIEALLAARDKAG